MGLFAFRRRRKPDVKPTPEPPKKEQPDYKSMTVAELKDVAKSRDVDGYSEMKKAELIEALQD